MTNLMTIRIQVSISNEQYGAGRLDLHHEFHARSMDFGQIAELLKRYDDLSKAIEQENSVPGGTK